MTDKQTTPFELFEADVENLTSYKAIQTDKYYMNTTKIMNVLKKQIYPFGEEISVSLTDRKCVTPFDSEESW